MSKFNTNKMAAAMGHNNQQTMLSLSVVLLGLFVHVSASGLVDMCPMACRCLGMFVDCSGKGLIEVPNDIPRWVTRLDLQKNAISNVRPDHFANLSKLESLDLSNNEISQINTTVLKHLPSLKELFLNNNKFKEIPNFTANCSLTQLQMHHNKIHSLDGTSLYNATKLRLLDLSYNQITDINRGTFPANNSLHQLILNGNRIIVIESKALDNLTSLETLKLNKNNLALLPKDVFVKLKRLKNLEMSRNRFKNIVGLMFKGLENLLVLKLRRNLITSLGDGAFWGLSRIRDLHLQQNNITSVMKWLYGLDTLEKLNVANNRISTIGSWQYCKKLLELDLTHNNLSTLTPSSFSHLYMLNTLYLDHNHITHISDNAFQGLTNLQDLSLTYNEIFWTIEDSQGAFVGLTNLKQLLLTNNHIKSIAEKAFTGLAAIEIIDLSNNNITTINTNVFSLMPNIKELKLTSHNFLCDCHLSWLPLWLKGSTFQSSVTAVCAHPEGFLGKSVTSLDNDDFKCTDFPKPMITLEPKSQIALKGQNVSLECEAVSTESSPVSYHWRKNDFLITNSKVRNEVTHKEGVYNYHCRLYLSHVQDTDLGVYQCIISNRFGSAYSQRVEMAVHVYPRFIKKPKDITVKAGSIARLECSASGSPPPVISWQKDGGVNFPAARERRITVMPNDHVFFIVETTTVDEGVYSCMATNAAGTIVANASITVSEVPTFIRKMENKITAIGKTSVLECLAGGTPKPRVNWLKDNEPLNATPRHFFTANNQLLIIIQTIVSDAGRYTCEVSNALGVETDSAILSVIREDGVATSGIATPGPHDINSSGHPLNLPLTKPVNQTTALTTTNDNSTSTEIMVIAIVCCVVGTSLVWVIIIYQTRIRNAKYNLTDTDETNLQNDPQTSSCNSSQKDAHYMCSQYMLGGYQYPDHHSKESGYDSSDGRKYRTIGGEYRGGVIDTDNHQIQPLLDDENRHKRVHYSGSSETGSLASSLSTGSTQFSGGDTLRTFRPYPSVVHNQNTTSPRHKNSHKSSNIHNTSFSENPCENDKLLTTSLYSDNSRTISSPDVGIRKYPSASVIGQRESSCDPRRITPYIFHYYEKPPDLPPDYSTVTSSPCTVYVNPHYDNLYSPSLQHINTDTPAGTTGRQEIAPHTTHNIPALIHKPKSSQIQHTPNYPKNILGQNLSHESLHNKHSVADNSHAKSASNSIQTRPLSANCVKNTSLNDDRADLNTVQT